MSTPSKVEEIEGDLFTAPEGAALIHACNCKGSWGAGIALEFKKRYPAAFRVYKSFCDDFQKNPHYLTTTQPSVGDVQVQLPEGHTLIIPPQPEDYEKSSGKKHWIICLFTSYGLGGTLSSPAEVLRNTETALADLKTQLHESQYAEIAGLYACRINSGLFKVDWNLTKQKMEQADLDITVISPS
ncbi:hypothetical protein BJX68DRAFT_227845 [Aspergillus pseudodeflectus]|uniref:ADP-ribose 1''-phosphate phosphatase n=2 Tax=Aspergillus subgen. Nidulantes TaxID=2720870 RepID=A0A0U5GUT5_ASPCI|nr:hypothetical protein ASPCAL09197 [Aspergillus calidoustus]